MSELNNVLMVEVLVYFDLAHELYELINKYFLL